MRRADRQWVCDNCGHIQANWTPICPSCGSFDTLTWKTPETPEIATATGVHMLPLILGALDDKSGDVEEAEAEDADEPADVPETEDADVVESTATPVGEGEQDATSDEVKPAQA